MKPKISVIIFVISFVLNAIWENLHSQLYIHYQGGPITELVLLRATLFDAVFITGTIWLIQKLTNGKHLLAWVTTISIIAAIAIELYALNTNRWAYGSTMPIIPLLNTGLTPTIQLGFLGYLSLRAVLGCESCFGGGGVASKTFDISEMSDV